jgi:hypothetical protein
MSVHLGSNSNNNNDKTEYNHSSCSRKGCNSIPVHYLRLVLLKKAGWFCEKCRFELQEDGLVESVIDENIERK